MPRAPGASLTSLAIWVSACVGAFGYANGADARSGGGAAPPTRDTEPPIDDGSVVAPSTGDVPDEPIDDGSVVAPSTGDVPDEPIDDGSVVAPSTGDLPDEPIDDGSVVAPSTGDAPEPATVVPAASEPSHNPASTDVPEPVSTTTNDASTADEPAVSGRRAEATQSPAPPRTNERLYALLDHFRLFGLTQVEYQQRQISVDELSDGTGEPLNEDLISIRRARLGFGADWRWAGGMGLIEFFDPFGTVRPISYDVHAQVPRANGEPPIVQLRAGLLPVPFGFETGEETDVERFFAERALLSEAFVPGRFDLGVVLSGHVWAIDWTLALQNGQPIGSNHYPYRDPNAAKDAAARVRMSGDLFGPVRAAVGVSGLYGKGSSAGTQPTKDSFEWQDLNEDGRVTLAELIPVPGSAGRPSSNFERWGAVADAQVWADLPRVGELMVYGEVALAVNLDRGVAPADPVLLGRDQRGLAWYVALRQHLTPYVSMGARYDVYEPNFDALEGYDGVTVVTRRPFHTITGSVSTQLPLSKWARVRLLAEYAHQRNSLGRDPNGRPAHLDNDTVRVRLSLAF